MQEEIKEAGLPEAYATLQMNASPTHYTQKQRERLKNTGQFLQPTYLQLLPDLKPCTCHALQRLRFLINTIIAMRFTVTITIDMTMPAACEIAHSGNEISTAPYSVWSNCCSTCGEAQLCHFVRVT